MGKKELTCDMLPGSEGEHGLGSVGGELTGGHLIHLSRVTQSHLPTVKVYIWKTFQHCHAMQHSPEANVPRSRGHPALQVDGLMYRDRYQLWLGAETRGHELDIESHHVGLAEAVGVLSHAGVVTRVHSGD